MSVTFSVAGRTVDYNDGSSFLNLSGCNACDLLQWLGLPPDSAGGCPARELAARCRRRLWDEPRNHDPARAPVATTRLVGARFTELGREAGYLRGRTEELLALALSAGDGTVRWS